MGLDVYLTRYENRALSKERERLYEERTAAMYERKLSDDAEQAERERIARELGLTSWGDDEVNVVSVRMPSTLDPEHTFDIGYFRSSYNESGINAYLGRVLGGGGLYAVFPEAEHDEYEFQPDWAAAKRRALEMAEALHDRAQSRPYDVTVVRTNSFLAPTALPASASAALELFCSQNQPAFDAYSSAQGEFFMKKPLPVRAFIPGMRQSMGNPTPVLYAVFDVSPDHSKWYETALRIVAETCDYVLSQPERDKFWLRWSA
jgi:hypothetical protein